LDSWDLLVPELPAPIPSPTGAAESMVSSSRGDEPGQRFSSRLTASSSVPAAVTAGHDFAPTLETCHPRPGR